MGVLIDARGVVKRRICQKGSSPDFPAVVLAGTASLEFGWGPEPAVAIPGQARRRQHTTRKSNCILHLQQLS